LGTSAGRPNRRSSETEEDHSGTSIRGVGVGLTWLRPRRGVAHRPRPQWI